MCRILITIHGAYNALVFPSVDIKYICWGSSNYLNGQKQKGICHTSWVSESVCWVWLQYIEYTIHGCSYLLIYQILKLGVTERPRQRTSACFNHHGCMRVSLLFNLHILCWILIVWYRSIMLPWYFFQMVFPRSWKVITIQESIENM